MLSAAATGFDWNRRSSILLSTLRGFVLLGIVVGHAAQNFNPPIAVRFAKPDESLVTRENTYWRRISLPVPESIVLEMSGILPLPGRRLLLTTRRGEMWWVDGAYDDDPQPRYSLFAAAPRGGYYVVQRQELTRIADLDGDGEADLFETVCKIPISGSFHEYAYGPVADPSGRLRITLNVAAGGGPTQSPVPWRGWIARGDTRWPDDSNRNGAARAVRFHPDLGRRVVRRRQSGAVDRVRADHTYRAR